MSITEFAQAYESLQPQLEAAPRRDAIAQACRGSGNPAVLAWLAEACRIDDSDLVLDVGGGLGGPAAWLHDRYGCRTISVEPVPAACRAASQALGVPATVGCGTALPFPDGSVDVSLLLGVLSCVPDPVAVVTESRRVARRLASITYTSTGDAPVRCGGSRFPTVGELERWLMDAGWTTSAGPSTPALPAPPPWRDQDDPEGQADSDEDAVVRAIDAGAIEPVLLVAS